MISFALLGAIALGAPTLASVPVRDPCALREEILAVRRADDASRASLRLRLDEKVQNSTGRARACAAAVAAEAARQDGDKARTLLLLDAAAAGLPDIAAALTPHRALLAAELGDVVRAAALLQEVPERSLVWRSRIELALARAKKETATTKTLLLKASARDPAALAELCDLGDRDRCVDLLVRHAGHALARAREDRVDVAAFALDVIDGRLKALLAAARPMRVVEEGQRWLGAPPTLGVVDGARRINADVGQALLRLNRNDEAVVVTGGFASVGKDGEAAVIDVDAARAHAKALGRAGKNRAASVVWLRLRDAALAAAVAADAPPTKTTTTTTTTTMTITSTTTVPTMNYHCYH